MVRHRRKLYLPPRFVNAGRLTAPPADANAPAAAAPKQSLPEPRVDEATGVRHYRNIAYIMGESAHAQKHRLDVYIPDEGKWRQGLERRLVMVAPVHRAACSTTTNPENATASE